MRWQLTCVYAWRTGVTKSQDMRSFTQEPILKSSVEIHLEVSFTTVTRGGFPKDRVLRNSALEIV